MPSSTGLLGARIDDKASRMLAPGDFSTLLKYQCIDANAGAAEEGLDLAQLRSKDSMI